MTTQMTNLPEQIRNIDLLLLSDWNKYFAYPKIPSFRPMLFHSKVAAENGQVKYNDIYKVAKNIAGRTYIKISAFFEWLEAQDKGNI